MTYYLARPSRLTLVAAAALAMLSGCATYQAQPLDEHSPLATQIDGLQLPAGTWREGTRAGYKLNPADGLNLIELGMLAVINNPGLRQLRAKYRVAGAQAFAAGLLPDPQLSAGLDKPTGNTAGLVDAWGLGLGYDIVSLINRQARIDAAHKGQDKVRLDLLWQEWQVIQRTRTLAVRLQLEGKRLMLLKDMRALYRERYRRSAQALQEGNVTLDVNGTDLTALVNILSQINRLEQSLNQTRHDLNLLLGLDPQVVIEMSPLPAVMALPAETVNARLARLAELRPDLLALKAGYESQEARVRAAILTQFPSLGIGINRARDTGNVYTTGLSINLSLPLFNGNRGNIAIERATREQLGEEFRARLAQARMDIDRLLALQTILHRQQENLHTYLPRLETLVERARRAYSRSDIGALTFLNMESTWTRKRLEQIRLTQAAWENRIALEALLALPGYPKAPLPIAAKTRETAP